jgi:hypothetical protein
MEVQFIPTPDDVAEIKAILNIQDSKHDDYIITMLPLLLEDVMVYTNNNFGGISATGSMNIPGGVKIYIAKTIQHNLNVSGLKSRTMGSVSYTYDLDFPDSFKRYLKPYKRLRFI